MAFSVCVMSAGMGRRTTGGIISALDFELRRLLLAVAAAPALIANEEDAVLKLMVLIMVVMTMFDEIT
jgi:hypothetical protein